MPGGRFPGEKPCLGIADGDLSHKRNAPSLFRSFEPVFRHGESKRYKHGIEYSMYRTSVDQLLGYPSNILSSAARAT